MPKHTRDHMGDAGIDAKVREFFSNDGANIQSVRLLLQYITDLEKLNRNLQAEIESVARIVGATATRVGQLERDLDRLQGQRIQQPLSDPERRALKAMRAKKERERRNNERNYTQRKKSYKGRNHKNGVYR